MKCIWSDQVNEDRLVVKAVKNRVANLKSEFTRYMSNFRGFNNSNKIYLL